MGEAVLASGRTAARSAGTGWFPAWTMSRLSVRAAAYPPLTGISRREALGVGCLLQCKGLMEIVAASILRDQHLISEMAYASLIVLALVSSLLTAPMFYRAMGRPAGRLVPAPVSTRQLTPDRAVSVTKMPPSG